MGKEVVSDAELEKKLESLSALAKETDSKRILAVQTYQAKYSTGTGKRQIRFYTIIFVLMYIYVSVWVASTIGQPYREFLQKAEREGFSVMEGATRYRAELEHAMKDLDDENRRTKKLGWGAWMDMDIEELVEEKKRDKQKSVLDSLPASMRVPGKHQTAFWPTLCLGILATLHALVILMQHWNVGFNVGLNYREIDAGEALERVPDNLFELDLLSEEEQKLQEASSAGADGAKTPKKNERGERIVFPDREISITKLPSTLPTHARIVPAKGRHVLLPLQYFPDLGMTFEYHRRRYVYDKENQQWTKIRCRTDFPLSFLETWTGFPAAHQLVAGQIRFGPNMFKVKQPTFVELYKAQLLNPFSVFQIFCVLLWAIDDYIVYSAFSLFMVLMFEGTVVFQRIKSLQALTNMGNPSRQVYVYRGGGSHWTSIDSAELLPGDILSLTRVAPHRAKPKDEKDKKAVAVMRKIEAEGGDVVPADLLLLRGSTVVNEASLTGESVPQMKEGLSDLEEGEELSMKVKHKMNVAYAGTKMLQCKGAAELAKEASEENDQQAAGGGTFGKIPLPPDNGCIAFVLRTGFSSAQGKLVRMIEGSQEKVKGHEKETGLLLLLLCVFAIISSSYVLYKGIQNEDRSKYELLLHCILIVTNVIRPELPMQMAMAVNNSLMTLMKMHVFCTEPYRVPVAGKLNSCLFDKTGTLTTDELVAVGVCEPQKLVVAKDKIEDDDKFLTPVEKLSGAAALVLAGCHSLVVYDEETTGDPLEKAALRSMRWHLSIQSGHAEPAPAMGKKPAGKPIGLPGSQITSIQVLTRHHFSSKLQRMSCVVRAGGKKYSVAKGSPEAIGKLLVSKPSGYDEKSQYLAKQGFRVIGLAYKVLASDADSQKAMDSRAACEADLIFAGFIAFTCMVRKDTADVLKRLKEGGMSVAMVTGDALLTAIHVAKEVHICEPLDKADESTDPERKIENEELRALLESKRKANGGTASSQSKLKKKKGHHAFKTIAYLDTDSSGSLYWCSYDDGSKVADYVASSLPELSQEYDLATTGSCLEQAYEDDTETHKYLEYIKVFARMTPVAKETVIESLHSVGLLCLMCGDGANDVGALKQADVGVALLSGFSNINVAKPEDEVKKPEKKEDSSSGVTAIMSQEHLNQIRALPVSLIKMKIKSLGTDPNEYPELIEKEDLVKLYQITARQVAVKRHEAKNSASKKNMSRAELQAKKKAEQQEMQRRLIERTKELEEQGVAWAQFKAMKEVLAEQAQQKKSEAVKTRGVEGSAANLAAQLDEMPSGDMPMIKLGDASIAAPFTSKMPSIRNCVDIVRQGRCTLVSSMQMYQIMALQCLISSYSLSVLYLDGVKYGDSQMTAMGLLGTVSFMSVSRSKPLDKLSKVQPLSSIFHPASFSSLLGQFAIHMFTMVYAVQNAKKHLPDDYEPKLDGEFEPGILNTVVFLVSSVQQVTVFFVNMQGRPFMTGITENRPLLWSLAGTFILTFMFASESVPQMNRYFQLVSFPDERFRDFILTILVLDLLGSFLFDRLMRFVFAREILVASIKETRMKDVVSLLKTFAIMGFLMWQFLGEETFNELMAMEELARNGANSTDDLSVLENVTECVEGVCDAVKDTVAGAAEKISKLHDEF